MIKNYLKVALRSIFRNKLTAFINIAGLALAMACALLIYLFISDEVSYEKYHTKADRIYRVTRIFHSPEGEVSLHLANVAPPIGPLLKNDFGEIEVLARTINFNLVIGLEENGQLKMANDEEYVFLAEPDIFRIFDIEVKAGDAAKALERPFTVMLSEKAAKKYFNSENIVGKRLRANNQYDLEITGVYKDFPAQAHWHPEFLVAFSTLNDDNVYGRRGLESNWGNNAFGTYMLLQEGADASKLEKSFPGFLDRHFGPFAKANWGAPADFKASTVTTLTLQKLTDIHLRSHLDDELEANGNINNVYMMGVIGLFIILIACFNFVNLSTARATKRSKEVGLRKVVGAFRNQLIGQYLSESVLIALIALALAAGIGFTAIRWMNDFTGKDLSLNFIEHLPLLFGLVGFAVVIGLMAGIYPAFVISSFKPALTLKGQQGNAKGKGGIRRVLVVAQFAISICLMIATFITFEQLRYLNEIDLGYNKEQVISIPYYNEVSGNFDAFYNELTKSASVNKVGRSSRVPTGRLLDSYGDPRVMKGDSLIDIKFDIKTIAVDAEFFNTYDIAMAAGRSFSKDTPSDDTLAYIVNEAAAKQIGWTNLEAAIGKDFVFGEHKGKLVGIVKNFHFESLHQQIVPIVFINRSTNYNVISVAIAGDDVQQGIAHVEKVWKTFLPARPFGYRFISERYAQLYEAEQKQSQLFTTFAGLAIFIASLGLFGLATFNTMQRVKEIGIRKVLGASVGSILGLLSREIVILIVAANLLAWPVAWYFMTQWLDTFAYHVDMSLVAYLLAAIGAILLALITVSSQTIKAAMTNPANTLRYE